MSNGRRYTVDEISRLREAVEHKWLYGTYKPSAKGWFSRSYLEDEKTKSVEAIIQTHMIAGHTADDLYASEAEAAK